MNKVALQGRIENTPEIKSYGNQGKHLASFSIAVDQNGDRPAEFFNCTAWGKAVEALRSASKGSEIVVLGKLTQSTWQDRETGKQRSSVGVTVFTAEVFDKPRNQKPGPQTQTHPQSYSTPVKPVQSGYSDIPY